MTENLEKFRSTEHYGAPLEGSTIFLCRSSTCRMSMESSRLAELKYAFSEGQDVRLKNYRARSSFFGRSLYKHGLLEGSTISLQYSAITPTPLESSQLGEFECEISPG